MRFSRLLEARGRIFPSDRTSHDVLASRQGTMATDGPQRISEDLLWRLFEGSSLAIQIYRLEDPDDLGSFRFLESNPAAVVHAGVSYETLCADLGKTLREIVPEILNTDAPARYKRVLETGRPDSFDLTFGNQRYSTMVLHVDAWPLDAQTIALAFTNVAQERETQRQLDEKIAALRIAYQELEASRARQVQVEKLASLGQLSAGIAHEINNPLLVIKGYAVQVRKLLEQEVLEQRAVLERSLERIERSCARIERIANRMSLSSRHDDRATVPLRVDEVLVEVSELLRPQLGSRGIELEIKLCPEAPVIMGNEFRLDQLVTNLMLNAQDAIVDVEGRAGRIELSVECPGGAMHLSVRDNGTGISEAVQRKMFDPFFSTKPPGSGTGLGLSIVHEIAQELGGHIDFATRLGEGTTFTLIVPIRSS